MSAVHGTSRYSIRVSELSTADTALVEMPAPMAYQMMARPMMVATRQARLVVILRNESIPVSTVSIAAVGVHAHGGQQGGGRQHGGDRAERGGHLVPATCSPTRPSVAPSRVASHAPIAISQTAEPEAPKNTAVMMPRGEVSRGMYRE